MIQEFAPFRVAAEQGRGIGVLLGPVGQVVMSELQQVGLLPQPRGGAAAQFETNLIYQPVTHAGNLAGWFVVVNAANVASGIAA